MLRASYPNYTHLIPNAKNPKTAFTVRLQEARIQASAQLEMALRYESGMDVEKNLVQAFTWCKKAADQEWPSAIYHLAYMHQEGIGTKKNQEQALKHYETAAVLHFAPAICELGWRDAHAGNHPKAIIRYKMAAEQNNALALYNLAWMHEQYDFFGLPLEKSDENTVIRYYTKAHHHEPRQQEGMLACFALILFTMKHRDDFLKNPWVDSLKKHPCRNQLPQHYQTWIDTIALPETSLKMKASLNCRLGIGHLIGAGLPQQNLKEATSYFQEALNLNDGHASIFMDIAKSIPTIAAVMPTSAEVPLVSMQRKNVQPMIFSSASEGTPLISTKDSENPQNGHTKKRGPLSLCPRACTIF